MLLPMTHADTDRLIRQVIGGDPAATSAVVAAAATGTEPRLLVAAALVTAALVTGTGADLLARASAAAVTTRDRQLVAIAAAHLSGDTARVHDLARDHLADHPDSLLVAWIATTSLATLPIANTSEELS
jgi:hypothetical protein